MSDTWMGAIGLVAVAAGGLAFFFGQRSIEGCLADLPQPLDREAERRLGRVNRAAIVVFLAVAIYLVARQFGHGRAGLYVCVAMLTINATVVAVLRVRWFDALHPPPEIATRHRRGSSFQMAGAWVCFAGCALYLLRP